MMICFGCNVISDDPLDYELADIISTSKSDDIWISSNYKTYKYIIPYRFFNPCNMEDSQRYSLKLVEGKSKLCF